MHSFENIYIYIYIDVASDGRAMFDAGDGRSCDMRRCGAIVYKVHVDVVCMHVGSAWQSTLSSLCLKRLQLVHMAEVTCAVRIYILETCIQHACSFDVCACAWLA